MIPLHRDHYGIAEKVIPSNPRAIVDPRTRTEKVSVSERMMKHLTEAYAEHPLIPVFIDGAFVSDPADPIWDYRSDFGARGTSSLQEAETAGQSIVDSWMARLRQELKASDREGIIFPHPNFGHHTKHTSVLKEKPCPR